MGDWKALVRAYAKQAGYAESHIDNLDVREINAWKSVANESFINTRQFYSAYRQILDGKTRIGSHMATFSELSDTQLLGWRAAFKVYAR